MGPQPPVASTCIHVAHACRMLAEAFWAARLESFCIFSVLQIWRRAETRKCTRTEIPIVSVIVTTASLSTFCNQAVDNQKAAAVHGHLRDPYLMAE